MRIIEKRGNQRLMNREKTLFLCSKKTPVKLYEYVFRWTDSLTEKDCVVCFNSTYMESEVLKALLVGKVPTILFVMNRFTDVNNIQIEQALKENRMLIVVLKYDGKGVTPRLRNEYVLSLCQHVICGYVNKNGSVFSLLAGRENVVNLIEEDVYSQVADSIVSHERWTVAQDKILLRMYYADMGIHAIHKKLQRSYAAICSRIHSMTQTEELLKGREFEDYVLGLFNIKKDGMLVLQEWQGDKSYGMIHPKNNSNPDFVFRYGEKEFAIECKWREKMPIDLTKDLFSMRRIENYKQFSEKRAMPVTIVLGIGGEPCYPDLLYIIPLESVALIVSDHQTIVAFRCAARSFDISRFLLQKDKRNRIEEMRKLYPNAYKSWSKDDDRKLLFLMKEKKSIKELTFIFKRNEGAIFSRIDKLLKKKQGVK